ncbi:NUDIX hydrolase [Vibrio cincinnatiensis]|uniref:NUDIX hydrolase n=1 Tax=Vibrio cincinnatiensis TaxID=675 RepID=UPI001EDF487F|nr:NUDIX hydrolase [Vibrio cincinnatiensis]MCG3728330.1 NUDIX hydrolase [Vibrio cincinnatiensis]
MSKTVHQWKAISVVEEPITLPTGKIITHTTIKHPGAAVILPLDPDKRIILINQFRPSLNKWLLELPAGTIESNEHAFECAQRELEEETGYSAEEWIKLGQVTPMAGFCDEIQHLFVAKKLRKTERLACDDDEVIEVLALSISELEQKIITGEISDAKTIACLSKAKLCGHLS